MKKKSVLITALITAVVAIFMFSVFQKEKPSKSPDAEEIVQNLEEEHDHEHEHTHSENEIDEWIELPEETLKTLSLKTATVKNQSIERELETTAVVEVNETRMSHVSPRVTGRVIKVNALLGDRVKTGQILAELDSIELGRAKAEYLKARADLEVARANYERENRLFKQEISSEKEYLEARGEFLRSEAHLKGARETLRLLGLSDNDIETLAWGGKEQPPSHFPLLAPFTGTVVEKDIVLGELIKPEDTPYTISDLSNLWIQLDIYEKDLRWVDHGTKVRIKVDAYPEQNFEGTVTYISDTLDESTRTAKARVEIPNPDRELKPGMFARAVITIPLQDTKDLIVIPDSAIYKLHDKIVAFVQGEEGKFAMKEIKLGQDTGSYVEVIDGLNVGDKVVIEGGFYLKSALLKEELEEGHAH